MRSLLVGLCALLVGVMMTAAPVYATPVAPAVRFDFFPNVSGPQAHQIRLATETLNSLDDANLHQLLSLTIQDLGDGHFAVRVFAREDNPRRLPNGDVSFTVARRSNVPFGSPTIESFEVAQSVLGWSTCECAGNRLGTTTLTMTACVWLEGQPRPFC